jgi:hypothetical protein
MTAHFSVDITMKLPDIPKDDFSKELIELHNNKSAELRLDGAAIPNGLPVVTISSSKSFKVGETLLPEPSLISIIPILTPSEYFDKRQENMDEAQACFSDQGHFSSLPRATRGTSAGNRLKRLLRVGLNTIPH